MYLLPLPSPFYYNNPGSYPSWEHVLPTLINYFHNTLTHLSQVIIKHVSPETRQANIFRARCPLLSQETWSSSRVYRLLLEGMKHLNPSPIEYVVSEGFLTYKYHQHPLNIKLYHDVGMFILNLGEPRTCPSLKIQKYISCSIGRVNTLTSVAVSDVF